MGDKVSKSINENIIIDRKSLLDEAKTFKQLQNDVQEINGLYDL